jgi:hypothetical protein
MYPHDTDIPSGLCDICRLNIGDDSPCGHIPIVRNDPVVVTASRFYTPQKDDEQIVIAPAVLSIGEGE